VLRSKIDKFVKEAQTEDPELQLCSFWAGVHMLAEAIMNQIDEDAESGGQLSPEFRLTLDDLRSQCANL
jgi:hypothetical protein